MYSAKPIRVAMSTRSLPYDFVAEVFAAKDRIQHQLQMVTGGRVAMQIKAAGWFEDAMKLDEARGHHREVDHHWRVFEKTVERFHYLDDGNIRAVVDELMI